MYLRDVWASCRRRWWLLLISLALSAAACAYAATVIQPYYEATASIVLVPPPSTEDPSANRYLGLGGLKQSADVVARSLASEETVGEIKAEAPDATYTVEPDFSTSAPILVVTAKSPTAERASDMLAAVLARVPKNLSDLQEAVGTKPSSQITTVMVARDAEPKVMQKARIRILAVVGLGLAVLSALGVAAVDGLLLRRASRRRAAAERPEDEDEADPLTDPGPDREPVGGASPTDRPSVPGPAPSPVVATGRAPRRRQRLASMAIRPARDRAGSGGPEPHGTRPDDHLSPHEPSREGSERPLERVAGNGQAPS